MAGPNPDNGKQPSLSSRARLAATGLLHASWNVLRRIIGALVKTRWRIALMVLLMLFLGLRLIVPDRVPSIVLERDARDTAGAASTDKVLVVIMHGLGGEVSRDGMVKIARRLYPGADLIAPMHTRRYHMGLSNVDPYELTNALEQTIHEAHERNRYDRIVMFGYSMGAILLRKTLVWALGEEQDRLGPKDKREWACKVDRFVSLAGMSRGWSIDPIPSKMPWYRYLVYLSGELFARFTGTGQLILAMQRGAPFVADLRVQWLNLIQHGKGCAVKSKDKGRRTVPPVIHLLGDRDDIVSAEDSRDLAASPGVKFVTLADTDHNNIGRMLSEEINQTKVSPDTTRRRKIEHALAGNLATLEIDKIDRRRPELATRPDYTRIVYIMHGIRDYADWADLIRARLERTAAPELAKLAIVPAKYGWFPMAPFLAYFDRQKNVRWFMDTYTENRATYPNLREFDFLGHSNGTYILASALQHYKTLSIDRVFFAGSVVPKHYPWIELLDQGQVKEVDNVVASADWVVAIFPRLFEQVADWIGAKPVKGVLDIGSAGFHGFEAASDARRKIRNIRYARGGHGTGVDVANEKKLEALAGFVLKRDSDDLQKAFQEESSQNGAIAFASNMSWAVWAALLLIVVLIGFALYNFRIVLDCSRLPRNINLGRIPLIGFVVVVVLLLFSI